MLYETRPDTIEYKGRKRTIDMLAWWCDSCGEGIFQGQPLADREQAFFELKAEVDGSVQRAADEVFEKHAGAFKKLAE
jgi:YgiT-type zinc finger domain-containing protein